MMQKIFKVSIALVLMVRFGLISVAQAKEDPGPGLVFSELSTQPIKGIHLALSTGELLIYSDEWVKFYDAQGRLLWKKEGMKYVTGGGVSDDGRVVIFQTSPEAKTSQQTILDLTLHILERSGEEILRKDNPHRYFTSILSPKGNYIVFGDPLTKKFYVYNRSMEFLWERDSFLWYVGFDPEERFLYDSNSGTILGVDGKRAWDLPSGMRFLGVSAKAEVILSQPFLGLVEHQKKIYLTSRVSLQQMILDGYCAGVSYDGALVAYQGLDQKVQVFRTQELLEKGKEASPLWSRDFCLAKILHFSRDNQTLLLYGETSQRAGEARLIDFPKNRQLWEKQWAIAPQRHQVIASEENRFLAIQTSPNTVEYYRLR